MEIRVGPSFSNLSDIKAIQLLTSHFRSSGYLWFQFKITFVKMRGKDIFVKYYRNTEEKFNFRKLNDDVANKTKWATPVGSKKSAPFRLSEINGKSVTFKTPLLNLMAPLIFILIGFFATITFSIVFTDKLGLFSILLGLLFGGVFIFLGAKIFWNYLDKAIFDQETGYFWRGKNQPNVWGSVKTDNYCKLSDIYAIQLIHENTNTVSNNRNQTKGSYEFNLVLNSGDRINLLAHNRRDTLQQDAIQLANFFKIPLWDATIG